MDFTKATRLKKFGFITPNSSDLDIRFIETTQIEIKRAKQIIELYLLLNDMDKAKQLEKGIFEFALVHTFLNNFLPKFAVSSYFDKYNEIVNNINGNKKINNKTLKQTIISNYIPPEYIAFMSPQQLHPEKWLSITTARKYREDKENNIATSDLYKCRKCGERKSKISQLQIRCADEPITTFVTCVVCYNTFVL